jgi:hypothetical protein
MGCNWVVPKRIWSIDIFCSTSGLPDAQGVGGLQRATRLRSPWLSSELPLYDRDGKNQHLQSGMGIEAPVSTTQLRNG